MYKPEKTVAVARPSDNLTAHCLSLPVVLKLAYILVSDEI